MKKIIAILLTAFLALSLCACGTDGILSTSKQSEADLGPIKDVRAALFTESGNFDREKVVNLLLPLTEEGNAEAAYYMGYMGLFHWYPDKEETEEWFLKAIEGGSVKALVGLGFVYDMGWGAPMDRDKAAEYVGKAVDKGILEMSEAELGPDGLLLLGMLYHGYGCVDFDIDKSQEYYKKAVDQNNTTAMYHLARMYMYELGEEFKTKGEELCLKGANLGDTLCMNDIGVLYQETSPGDSSVIKRDDTKAVEWFKKAAELGNQSAMHNLGCHYYNGDGVEKDKAKALEWHLKAADGTDHHNGYSMYMVGTWYEWENDYATAFEWYYKGAQTDDVSAIYALAEAYRYGKGTDVDYTLAMEWYMKAAEQWDVNSMMAIGDMYANGEGVPQDSVKAQEWYDKANNQ